MKFYSTRDKNNLVSFKEAVFQGLSPEGGLFNPAELPDLSKLFDGMDKNSSFIESSAAFTAAVLKDDLTPTQAESICKKAFTFKPEITQAEGNINILELYHGPSCAFKDFGASFLAASMEEFLTGEERKAIIVTATSGDTGSAVAQSFHKKENIEVVILYPSGRVTPLQEKQLTTLGDNVTALEVKGSFDDCQRMAKAAFTDTALSALPLTSANSINMGRLFPQSFYYIYASNMLKKKYKELVFCIPSGNFGNITSGIFATLWGLPVKKFIAATNLNKEVPEYLESGIYNPRPSVLTYSNAMDVGNPSNFERLEDIFKNNYKKMGEMIEGQWLTDEETLAQMKRYYEKTGSFIDPHTAVAYTAAMRYAEKNKHDECGIVTLSTAHPGKFLEVTEKAVGKKPPLPIQLEKLLKLNKVSIVVENSDDALKKFLLEKFA